MPIARGKVLEKQEIAVPRGHNSTRGITIRGITHAQRELQIHSPVHSSQQGLRIGSIIQNRGEEWSHSGARYSRWLDRV